MSTEDAIYRALQREIDKRMPVGFPESKTGLDIKMLKMLFTPKEAKLATFLSALPETAEQIHKRIRGMNISLEELKKMLEVLFKKGAISKSSRSGRYSLAQFAVGFYEYQVDKLTPEFAAASEEYMEEIFHKEIHRKDRTGQIHTIPVEKSLTQENYAAPYEDIRKIVENKPGPFYAINCVCRQTHDLTNDKCKLSDMRRVCIMLKKPSHYTEEDKVTEIPKEEFFDMLKKFQKEGFVLQPENNQDPGYICVCCGCCCGILTSAKQFPKPAEYYNSNFYAKSNIELCNGCEVCVKRCQMDAIDMVDEKAVVNLDRCIGCGNCVPYCGQKAMTLIRKKKTKVPPKNRDMMYIKIMAEKKGIVGALGAGIKRLLGKKV